MNEIVEAIQYSAQSITIVTGLVLLFLIFKSVQALVLAYRDNKTYDDMRKNPDRTGLGKFYYGVITAMASVVVFFLPYFLR